MIPVGGMYWKSACPGEFAPAFMARCQLTAHVQAWRREEAGQRKTTENAAKVVCI